MKTNHWVMCIQYIVAGSNLSLLTYLLALYFLHSLQAALCCAVLTSAAVEQMMHKQNRNLTDLV